MKSVVKVVGVSYGGPWFETLVNFLFRHFCAPFLPRSDALLEYLDPVILHVWFLLYNFVAVSLLLSKLSKGTATMISLCTHQFSSYSYARITL